MQFVTLAEHHDLVTGHELCVAVDENSFAGTHESAYIAVGRQTHVLDHIASDAAVFGNEELNNLRIGRSQVLHVLHACLHEQTVDVTGGDGFLVKHSADLELLGHADIVHVLDLGDSLSDAKPPCCQACEDVRLAAVGNGYKRVGVLYSLLLQDGHIAAVGMDDHGVAQLLGEPFAQFAVSLQHLDGLAFRQGHHRLLGNLAAAEEDDIVNLALALAGLLTQDGHVLTRADGINHVTHLHGIGSARDDCLLSAFDGYNAVVAVGKKPRHELLANHRSPLADLDHAEVELPVAEREVIPHPVLLERLAYLLGSQHLWIDEVVQTHVLEEALVLRQQILVVVDTRKGLLGSQLVGYQAGGHVLRF